MESPIITSGPYDLATAISYKELLENAAEAIANYDEAAREYCNAPLPTTKNNAQRLGQRIGYFEGRRQAMIDLLYALDGRGFVTEETIDRDLDRYLEKLEVS